MNSSYLKVKLLTTDACHDLSHLLLTSPAQYTKYFHPFNFQPTTLFKILEKTNKDCFFGIELDSYEGRSELVGFYMLRGLDEGYKEPMYGVFISHKYSGKGLARFSIIHAECFCKFNDYHRLLLKVHPENIRAKNLYMSLGFQFLRTDVSNDNIVLYKNIFSKGDLQ